MDDLVDESRQAFLGGVLEKSRNAPGSKSWTTTRWICTLVLSLVAVIVCFWLLALVASDSRVEYRAEELDYPRFQTKQRRFTGGLKYDGDGLLFRDDTGEGRSYVGNDSAVDQAWTTFDAIQTIELDPREVKIEGLYTNEHGKVVTILDGFHQLHCLNQIRLALYDPGYLTVQDPKRHMHVDHCIDYLRQSIQCRADLTPLKLYYSEAAGRLMVDFEGVHTCRDFDAVEQWAWQHHASHIEML